MSLPAAGRIGASAGGLQPWVWAGFGCLGAGEPMRVEQGCEPGSRRPQGEGKGRAKAGGGFVPMALSPGYCKNRDSRAAATRRRAKLLVAMDPAWHGASAECVAGDTVATYERRTERV
jgi:hypothetical protein